MGHGSTGIHYIHRLVSKHFHEVELRNIAELLDSELKLTAANGSAIPYKGWVEFKFSLAPSHGEL